MLLLWRIRYLDSCDRTFKDRDLWLDTYRLNPVARAAVELQSQLRDAQSKRGWLRFRDLFHESTLSSDELKTQWAEHTVGGSFCLPDYFEDENGHPLSPRRMAEILTGKSNAITLPAGTRQHVVDYALAPKRPMPIRQMKLGADDLRILSYFSRDLRELMSTAFFRDGPGELSSVGGANFKILTAVTDEEIRSFVTIFRRLYMEGEPAGFLKAVCVFSHATDGHPLGQFVAGEGTEYQNDLNERPCLVPSVGDGTEPFSRKHLIDVFLYTQYAHQPCKKRQRQYVECLSVAQECEARLFWLFLFTIWECTLHFQAAGIVIADGFDRYCQVHGVACDVISSVARDNPGIGMLEKREDRECRLFDESVERLAIQLWKDAGEPDGRASALESKARNLLSAAIGSPMQMSFSDPGHLE